MSHRREKNAQRLKAQFKHCNENGHSYGTFLCYSCWLEMLAEIGRDNEEKLKRELIEAVEDRWKGDEI